MSVQDDAEGNIYVLFDQIIDYCTDANWCGFGVTICWSGLRRLSTPVGGDNWLAFSGHRFDLGAACHLTVSALAGLCHLYAAGDGANGFAHIANVSHKVV